MPQNQFQRVKRKVCQINTYSPFEIIGGTEVGILQISESLPNIGYDVFTMYLDRKMANHIIKVSKKDNMTSYKIGFSRPLFYSQLFDPFNIFNPYVFLVSHRAFRRIKPDIAHFHNLHGGFSLAPIVAAKEKGIPSVFTIHDYWLICPKTTCLDINDNSCFSPSKLKCLECCFWPKSIKTVTHWKRMYYLSNIIAFQLIDRKKWMFRLTRSVDKFIAVSNAVKKSFVKMGFPAEKIEVIPRWVSLKQFQSLQSRRREDRTVLYVGGLTRHKGLDMLIRAMARISKKVKNCRLLIVGKGMNENYYKKMVKTMKLQNNIHFLGYIPHEKLPQIYAKVAITIVPSIWPEPFPRTAVESLATGTPVIASNIGGLPEIVVPNQNGYLISPNDSDQLAETTVNLLLDRQLREKMGKNGREYVKKFNLPDCIKKIVKVYEEIIERKD